MRFGSCWCSSIQDDVLLLHSQDLSLGSTAAGVTTLYPFLVYFMMGRICPGVAVSIQRSSPGLQPGEPNQLMLVSYWELVWSLASLEHVAPRCSWCRLSSANKAQAGVCDAVQGL